MHKFFNYFAEQGKDAYWSVISFVCWIEFLVKW